jgi:hypothetical protein
MSDKRGSVSLEGIIGQLRDRIARLERGSIGPPVYTAATLPAATTAGRHPGLTCPTLRPARRCSIRTVWAANVCPNGQQVLTFYSSVRGPHESQ